MGKKLSDTQLAERAGHTSAETLRKRAYRAKKKAKAAGGVSAPQRPRLAQVVSLPATSASTERAAGRELDPHAQAIFDGIRAQFATAGRWNEAMAPVLRTYSRASALIDSVGIDQVSNGLLVAQARAATLLDLPALPAAKRAASERDARRYLNW